MFRSNRMYRPLQLAFCGISLLSAFPSPAAMLCSWNLDSSSGRSANTAYVARSIQACDLVALQGVSGNGQVDVLQMTLLAQGGDWAQLPPDEAATDKAFLFNQDVVQYMGRRASYDGDGGGLSGRFSTYGGLPFVMASVSGREPAAAPYDLSSYLGFLRARYPEDSNRWVIAGQLKTPANDPAMRFFRRDMRPLIHAINTELPATTLETNDDGVRMLAKAEKAGEADDQVWIPIGTSLIVKGAGAIDYLAAIEKSGVARPSVEDAQKQVSPYLPVYVYLAEGSRRAKGVAPMLIPSRMPAPVGGPIVATSLP